MKQPVKMLPSVLVSRFKPELTNLAKQLTQVMSLLELHELSTQVKEETLKLSVVS